MFCLVRGKRDSAACEVWNRLRGVILGSLEGNGCRKKWGWFG